MAAFAFSRIKFPGREIIFTLFLATMMIPGEMMVISNYITVVKYMRGMDTYWAMIVPFLISVYYIYLLRTKILNKFLMNYIMRQKLMELVILNIY